MHVNLVSSFSGTKSNRPNVNKNLAQCPTPKPAKLDASVYFTGDDNLRKAIYPVILATGLSMASCEWFPEIEADAKAIVSDTLVVEHGGPGQGRDTSNVDTTLIDTTNVDTIPIIPIVPGGRDTMYIDPFVTGDSVVVDSGDYVNPVDSIEKWKIEWVRPELLDTLMTDMNIFDNDSADVDITDPKAKRNIIHLEGIREWEYNTKEIDDINLLESRPGVDLTYDTEFRDYKDRPEGYGKLRLAYPKEAFTVKTADGKRVWNSPKGYFVEFYKNPTQDKHTALKNCQLKKRFFCQQMGDSVRVFTQNSEGDFVEAGRGAKGYIAKNSILLRGMLIGRNNTDDHFVNVHLSVVDDEKLKALYIRQKDDYVSRRK
ncbi:hypothetical protein IJ579_03260 [bacterium]|nr:hypothetical protein [bacterium]